MDKIKKILPGLMVSIIIGFISIFLAKFVPSLGAATISIFLRNDIRKSILKQKSIS